MTRKEVILAFVRNNNTTIVDTNLLTNWLRSKGESQTAIESAKRTLRQNKNVSQPFAKKIGEHIYQILVTDAPVVPTIEPQTNIIILPSQTREDWDIQTFNETCGSLANVNALPLVCTKCGNLFGGSLYTVDVNPYTKKFHRGKRVKVSAECPNCARFKY